MGDHATVSRRTASTVLVALLLASPAAGVTIRPVGARQDSSWMKPAVLGVVAGSPEEVQLAAINALLEDQPLSRGMRLHATVHYWGSGQAVAVRLGRAVTPPA